jgi:hypothetical protein
MAGRQCRSGSGRRAWYPVPAAPVVAFPRRRRRAGCGSAPTALGPRPATSAERPAPITERPAPSAERPATITEPPATITERPATPTGTFWHLTVLSRLRTDFAHASSSFPPRGAQLGRLSAPNRADFLPDWRPGRTTAATLDTGRAIVGPYYPRPTNKTHDQRGADRAPPAQDAGSQSPAAPFRPIPALTELRTRAGVSLIRRIGLCTCLVVVAGAARPYRRSTGALPVAPRIGAVEASGAGKSVDEHVRGCPATVRNVRGADDRNAR